MESMREIVVREVAVRENGGVGENNEDEVRF